MRALLFVFPFFLFACIRPTPSTDTGDPPDDTGCDDPSRWYADADSDGYGDPDHPLDACAAPAGAVRNPDDCDDRQAGTHPGADEWCDGVDNDCDGLVDDDPLDPLPFYRDADGDGWGVLDDATEACAAPDGYADQHGDCDDDDPWAFPEAEPVCGDGVDNDCDGLGDCGLALSGVGVPDDALATFAGTSTAPLIGAIVGGQDLTGDGQPDWIAAAPVGDGTGSARSMALVFAGPAEGTLTPADAAFRVTSERSYDLYNQSLTLGDLNDDGQLDAVFGAPYGHGSGSGVVHVAYGPLTGDVNLSSAGDVVHLLGLDADDNAGAAVLVQDFSDDGVSDLVIGAPGADSGQGEVWFVEGPDTQTEDLDRVARARLTSQATFGSVALGGVIASAGDVNGDGRDDLLLGQPDFVMLNTTTGRASVVVDAPAGHVLLEDLAQATLITSGDANLGASLAGAGDVDGDGYGDILIGAPGTTEGVSGRAGRAWLIPGEALEDAAGDTVGANSIALATYVGAGQGWSLGVSVASAGDLTDDGAPEVLIGVPGYGRVNSSTGATALFDGAASGTLLVSQALWRFEGDAGGADMGVGVGAVSDLNGLGLPELVISASGGNGAHFLVATDAL
ncbi:MAG: putative metal-binding motif-containing protein [Alphaproteobacteria bacterium]|nr:putative metal-binding motif-containing protein [Alphaproteobacteria bacterium]